MSSEPISKISKTSNESDDGITSTADNVALDRINDQRMIIRTREEKYGPAWS